MTNSERASYIRGLMDGLELDPAAKETKVFNAMVELLDDPASLWRSWRTVWQSLPIRWMKSTKTWEPWKRITTVWATIAAAMPMEMRTRLCLK